LAVCALLPRRIGLLSSSWVIIPVNTLVFIAWFFTFAMKWLEGIKNTSDFEQWAVSVLGIFWLFCPLIVLTRGLTIITLSKKHARFIPFVIPAVMLWQTVNIFRGGDLVGGVVLALFVAGSIAIALRKWAPAGEFLIGTSR
jgi:hypothetical protein